LSFFTEIDPATGIKNFVEKKTDKKQKDIVVGKRTNVLFTSVKAKWY
jgi:hypothetical protein